ncbi:hypothetical protein KNP414_06578 [Paenibacillus mucilaginosus KNP414]|uniref:Uncharacterized protein n=1 Tax=Paenibacillus mucilaginosus (strain KNP414) TaxID=1036673 RepID=F8F774_PAEMK|nr:hypothetical protein KNP414_06578 [Paenibacillus mucilaginosus KNP414]
MMRGPQPLVNSSAARIPSGFRLPRLPGAEPLRSGLRIAPAWSIYRILGQSSATLPITLPPALLLFASRLLDFSSSPKKAMLGRITNFPEEADR